MHLRHPQLSGLGRNLSAPEDVLVRLARHPAGRHGMSMRQGQLPDIAVEALLAHSDPGDTVHLHGRRISAVMQRRIAAHPDPAIRDAFPAFVRTMVERRVRVNIEDLEQVYGQPRADLLAHPDPRLRAAVAEAWRDRPLEALTRMLADTEPAVREAATRHRQPGLPAEVIAACLADPATCANVARYAELTSEQVLQLIRDGDDDLVEAVAGNPQLPAAAIEAMADVPHLVVRLAVAWSRHVDADTRDRLFSQAEAAAAAGDSDARIALAWNVTEPWWLLDEPLERRLSFLDAPRAEFRRVLADCRDLPEHAWQRLDNDPDLRVRRAAARRPDTPAEVLERLVRGHGEARRIRPTHVEHPNFPREQLRTFVEDPNPAARRAALQDPTLPVDALERLAAEPGMRQAVAAHPMLDEALFSRLLADTDPAVVETAAANSILPPDLMYRILAELDL
ncbi:hypothetical protein [Catellatospora sp. TT07R-123]|uniref:hypothetical protein n=1 Tax=Catellatospora sp. TT07R-123 TaxID=2733863 RepID=UPI001FD00458|nr:hypothetical protein [Catellatospora sp. TT07R-123]